MTRIFIDGSAGTTGLRIHDRLKERKDLELITLTGELRKDPEARKKAIFDADVAFLCLPDAAAIEAVALAEGSDTVIIDTSTAHRTAEGWAYGFAELTGYRERIKSAKRIANPGCHASGFISLVAPLVEGGLLKKDAHISSFSLTGYSGGGKKMIEQYENGEDMDASCLNCDAASKKAALSGRDPLLNAPRQYGITQKHKHLPEMQKICGLDTAPVFCPIVADYYSGMEVTVPVFSSDLNASVEEVRAFYRSYYNDRPGLVRFEDSADDGGLIAGNRMSGRDDMVVTVTGNEDRILLVSLFDNLGKGASGAAIQNMNIVLGVDEKTGLTV